MAKVYALLQSDGSLLVARSKGSGWAVAPGLSGVESNGKNLTVFLDGLDVLGVSANIPAKNEKQARRAAPFAIEEELADGVEGSHVALSPQSATDAAAARRLNVIAIETLKDVIDALAVNGLSEAAIAAAHSVLPDGDAIYQGPGILLGRLGERSFSLDLSIGNDVLVGLIGSSQDLDVYGDQLARAVSRPVSGPGLTSPEAFLVQLAQWAEAAPTAINLRQGSFAPKRSIEFDGFGHWRLVGGLAAVAAVGWYSSVVLETRALNERSDTLASMTDEFARVGWPEATGGTNEVLATLGTRTDTNPVPFPSVLDLSAVLYDALSQIEGSELRTIRYDRSRSQMSATVAFDSFADVDRLTTIVGESGLQARSGDSRQSGSRVIGDFTLELAS